MWRVGVSIVWAGGWIGQNKSVAREGGGQGSKHEIWIWVLSVWLGLFEKGVSMKGTSAKVRAW